MMQRILAIDAGGTTTRAIIVDLSGHCLGFGLAGGGNPISAGVDAALASLEAATQMALGVGWCGKDTFTSALVAMAGASARAPREWIANRLTGVGLRGNVEIESDILATFCSGTWLSRGYALVAGTGAVAARIEDGRLDRVSDGVGWLLGDGGSGYWIGHQVVRAVVASLDNRGPETALTKLVLDSLQLTVTSESDHGRPLVLLQVIESLYSLRPIELSRFAPLCFEAGGDRVASEILATAATELDKTLSAVRDATLDGPLVLGGSILTKLAGTAPLADLLTTMGDAELLPVQDGIVGAAVLGLRRAGVHVDGEIFNRINQSVMRLRETAAMNGSSA